jgi:S-adenosylmethionine hydrolase
MTKIISLTTDFGLKDPYVAEMKAVILGICPEAVIVDVTHEVPKFDVRTGAYMLASATPYFPKGTIHVAVVDPGVGTKRRPLLIQTGQGFFVGPDNGILTLAAEKQGIISIREITNPKLMRPHVSSTFHGRDVFAPAAAHLAAGVSPAEFGPEIQDVVEPDFAKVAFSKGALIGEVLHVDGFGNIITNVTEQELERLKVRDSIVVEVAEHRIKTRFCRTYAETKPGEALALIGSQGYLEIAVNQGNATEKFKVQLSDKVRLLLS